VARTPISVLTGEPVNVLCLIKGLGRGGAERLLVTAARLSDRQRFRLHVAYLLPWKDALVGDLQQAGVGVTCLDASSRSDLGWIIPLRRLMGGGNFRIVHSHSPLIASGARLAVLSLPSRLRPLLVSTEHNTWNSHGPLTRLVNRATFRLDHAHLAVSEDTRRSLPVGLRPQVQVVTHGTEVSAVQAASTRRSAVRASLGVAEDEVVVITVANLRSHKGYPDLLAAARRVLDRSQTPCRFIVVGLGPLDAWLRKEHERLKLGDRFQWLGRRDEVFDLLAGSDMFALASHYEGFPIAIVEALAAGLPVVATNVGGVSDAVRDGHNGYLVERGDVDGLAGTLIRLVDDPELRIRLGHQAARSAEAFDAAKAVRVTEQLYERLLETRPTSPVQGQTLSRAIEIDDGSTLEPHASSNGVSRGEVVRL
jgi:glycosyltransferase involved in cell wall biosynthesis